MKVSTTSARLKEIMCIRGLRQIDILNAAKPYCVEYGVKLEKNDLSQYVNAKVEPGQEKLTILGLALNVSETWLMGYNVPMERNPMSYNDLHPQEQSALLPLSVVSPDALDFTEDEIELVRKYRCLDDRGKSAVRNVLEHEYASLPGESANLAPKQA